ncbi:MFP1 attachment factor 1 [Sesamum indicum]|uniref:MFP1 attachment factor 1 n=1 Tax=Sesamum indicum TaxID=4182 RepID=A0A6I9SK54_SESIN|nr:MFP1 attachment factor 1 [Sesamum indicum]
MSDNIESPNQNPQDFQVPDLAIEAPPKTPLPTTMAEAEQAPPQSETTAATAAAKYSSASFCIWPPTERTRDAVRNRLIETLSTPSILSKRYGTVSREEAVDAAKRIEDEAFEAAGKAASTDDDGIEILQVYSKEISKRMLETVKARSAESVASQTPPVNEAVVKAEEEDTGSTAPPQSEKTESVADDE